MACTIAGARALQLQRAMLGWRPMASAVRVGVRLRQIPSAHPTCGTSSLLDAHNGKHSFSSIGFQRTIGLFATSDNSVHDKSSSKVQPQIDSFGVNNFRNMLQYQEFTPTANNKKRYKKKRRHDQQTYKSKEKQGHVVGEDASSDESPGIVTRQGQNNEGTTVEEMPKQTNTNTDYPDKTIHKRSDESKQRYSWRGQQNRKEVQSKKTHHVPASSEWVLISNVPPMSNLSDLSQSLAQIIEYELQKGIIDLDKIQSLEKGSDEERSISSALDEIGATTSLYATEPINNENIPLWVPSTDTYEDISSMILETRVHLSYRARPTGWFLRLPNRSVVHAVLNHISLAKKHNRRHEYRINKHNRQLSYERKRWKDGLWRGVQAEYRNGANVNKNPMEKESHDDRDSMWGDGLGDDEEVLGSDASSDSFDAGDSYQGDDDDNVVPQDEVDQYIQQYLETNPFPVPSQSSPDTNNLEESPYHLLKSGSTTLGIQEFKPATELSGNNRDPSWEQHSFNISPQLNLSDSVIRVETSNLRTNTYDIQFLFRGYDLESISSEEPEDEAASTTSTPSPFSMMPISLGWNINQKGNVDYLVYGSDRTNDHDNARGYKSGDNTVNRAKWHTFLVRFSCPAEARMAVRDKQGYILNNHELSVAQYPQQL